MCKRKKKFQIHRILLLLLLDVLVSDRIDWMECMNGFQLTHRRYIYYCELIRFKCRRISNCLNQSKYKAHTINCYEVNAQQIRKSLKSNEKSAERRRRRKKYESVHLIYDPQLNSLEIASSISINRSFSRSHLSLRAIYHTLVAISNSTEYCYLLCLFFLVLSFAFSFTCFCIYERITILGPIVPFWWKKLSRLAAASANERISVIIKWKVRSRTNTHTHTAMQNKQFNSLNRVDFYALTSLHILQVQININWKSWLLLRINSLYFRYF